eukprot:205526_1
MSMIAGFGFGFGFGSTNFLFKYMVFTYDQMTVYEIALSMVQGTISGGDCSTFFCLMNEVMRVNILKKHTLLYFRYKDDIFMLPAQRTDAATVDNLLQSVYKDAGFEFEIEVKLQQAQ